MEFLQIVNGIFNLCEIPCICSWPHLTRRSKVSLRPGAFLKNIALFFFMFLPTVVVVPLLYFLARVVTRRSSRTMARRVLLGASPALFLGAILVIYGPGNFSWDFILPMGVSGLLFGAVQRIPDGKSVPVVLQTFLLSILFLVGCTRTLPDDGQKIPNKASFATARSWVRSKLLHRTATSCICAPKSGVCMTRRPRHCG